MKNKYTIIGIIITTIILAGVAIFTAMRLYQTRDVAVAPNVPSSKPVAQEATPTPSTCQLSFAISIPTATATATSTSTSSSSPTATATATGTASPTGAPNSCNGTCGSNSNCQSNYICYIPSGSISGNCRNTQCLTETDCTCAVATTSATVAPTQPSLPVVGTSWPTLLGTGFGVLVIIGSLLLAL